MPYALRGRCVVRADTGATVKCHPSRARAVRHLRALKINVREAAYEESEHPRGEGGRWVEKGDTEKDTGGGRGLPGKHDPAGRREAINDILRDELANGHSTEDAHEHHEGSEGRYDADREAAHDEFVREQLQDADDRGVDKDYEAIILGGLPGAGKSSSIEDPETLGLNQDDWLVVSADTAKEYMAENDMIPRPEGFDPMEASSLVGDEAMKMAWDLAETATAEGYNVIWDVTGDTPEWFADRITEMNDYGMTQEQLKMLGPELGLAEEPYTVTGIFVDVPVAQAIDSVNFRYANGLDSTYGGRPVPTDFMEAQADPTWGSVQRAAFEASKDQFDQYVILDNMNRAEPGEPVRFEPKVIEQSPGFSL